MDKVGKGTTHLVCTKKCYENDPEVVKQARIDKIPVVTYDWFEDSLQRQEIRPVSKYQLSKFVKTKAKDKLDKKKVRHANVNLGGTWDPDIDFSYDYS